MTALFGAQVLLLVLLLLEHSCGQVILQAPKDTTVFVNQKAKFTCETNGADYTNWRLNRTSGSDLSSGVVGDTNITGDNSVSTLTILARAVYNGTIVECVTGDAGHDPVMSDIVTLIIQELTLETDSTNSFITVAWRAPSSSTARYSVLIYNITDEDNPTAVPCTDCHNITKTRYTFCADYRIPCYRQCMCKYNFSVIPYNELGPGESSQNITGYTLKDWNPSVEIGLKTIVYDDSTDDTKCKVFFEVSGDVESICNYILRDKNDPAISVKSSLGEGNLIVFTLPTDTRYSTFFEINNAAANWSIPGTNFTTFDVQKSIARGGNEILITVQFISNSQAMGCFVVLQSNDDFLDVFRVILRNDTSQPNVTDVISTPPSNYTMYVYDLEKDGRINCKLADWQREYINVTEATEHPKKDLKSTGSSKFLSKAELSMNGSEVTITCEFVDEYPEASCVLVYREYNDIYLTVQTYTRSTKFPFTLSVDNPEKYTFALFGKYGLDGIEKEPAITLKNESHAVYMSSGEDGSSRPTASIVVCIVAALVTVLNNIPREERINRVKVLY